MRWWLKLLDCFEPRSWYKNAWGRAGNGVVTFSFSESRQRNLQRHREQQGENKSTAVVLKAGIVFADCSIFDSTVLWNQPCLFSLEVQCSTYEESQMIQTETSCRFFLSSHCKRVCPCLNVWILFIFLAPHSREWPISRAMALAQGLTFAGCSFSAIVWSSGVGHTLRTLSPYISHNCTLHTQLLI